MYNLLDVDFFTLLQTDINDFHSQGKVFIIGDWNSRTGDRADYIVCDRNIDLIVDANYLPDIPLSRDSVDNVCNMFGLKLIELCKSTCLRIANGRLYNSNDFTFTCHTGSSVIDYLLLYNSDMYCVNDFTVHPFCEWSDHAKLSFNILCKTAIDVIDDVHIKRTHVKWNPDLTESFRRGIIGKLPDFNRVVNNIDNNNPSTIDASIVNFTSIMREIADPLFSKTINRVQHPYSYSDHNPLCKQADWFDQDCRNARNAYINALNNFYRVKCVETRHDMCTKKTIYKRLIRKKKRAFEAAKCRQIVNLRSSKPKDFWRLFNKKKNNPARSIDLDDFFNYFSSLQEDLVSENDLETDTFCNDHDFNDTSCTFAELDCPITVAEVEFAIRGLKTNKSCAGDNLINEYFIQTVDILKCYLVDIFNAILNTGHFPAQWTKGILVPLFKKNDPSDVNNYRGITLVSCFSNSLRA
ncbi:uncharacterized protein LOC132736666 [Ruditapes philippinarum]|uniref:uncharacterized protein LOC132736666 n=1 Tax=Ruditapes philippinarum TaxID=129788 RepID=UPI00295C00EB|nr:uncharacterized protein LOC132736666 [Ruditapes philippinarum]